ncbi:MAG: hypothetical protein CMH46_05200 [Muricauda sp.]|nr:S41 family peptidase [Allomuricauda sp.]MAU14920.1 hypothetical protein [Allomuricauda sp.]|tara:strand:+ start:12275 stop:13690 length:1416 start_codon:yes stop_codon:yes gene_type:complete
MKIVLCLTGLLLNFHLAFTQIDGQSLNGIWEMDGYGKIIEISDREVSTYDVTKISCLLNYKTPRNNIKQLGKFELINPNSLNLKLGITEYHLHRIKELPKQKLISDSIRLKKPKLNFDVFWHTLNDNYPFFERRKTNWQEVYDSFKNENYTNDKDLFKVFRKIIEQLGDEHTAVIASEDIMEDNQDTLDVQVEDSGSEHPSMADLGERILNIYVKEPVKYGRSLNGHRLINYGLTRNNVGYVQLNNMIFFGDYKVSDSLSGYDYLFAYLKESGSNPNYQEDEVKGISQFLDSIIQKFKDTDAMILDLRFNTGGYDFVALEVLRHFIEEETTVFSKKAKKYDAFTEKQFFTIKPSNNTYQKPVFLLTSHQTSSAPEILVLSSMSIKNIQRIGSNTKGIFSDVLEKKLPNGWDLYLSNEIYEDNEGNCYEGIGVSPDIEINYPVEENLFIQDIETKLKNGDDAIETVFKLIKA